MGDGDSNGTTSDTLELLKAEREDLEKTVACVRQMAWDFDTLTDQRKSFDAKRIAFHLQLKGPHLRRCVWKGIITPEAFQWHEAAIARKKALGEQVLQDTAAFAKALIRWAEDLEKREQQYRRANLEQQIVRDPINHAASDESRSQDNSGGHPGVLIYTNNWDTYSRYTTSQSKYGQLASANVIYVGSPDSSDNVFLATDNPLNVSPSFMDVSYDYRVIITQGESWYYCSAQDAQTKQEAIAFNAISSLTPLMVGFSPTAGAGGDLVDAVGVAADTERTPAGGDMVTLYHQGDLENGVSANRSLSTSVSPDLSHYDPNGLLYQFDLPRDTLNEWLNTGAADSFIDFHAPSGNTTPEIRIWPPKSRQMNHFLVPNSP